MFEQPVDRDLVAVHDVEHAVGQPRLRPQRRASQFAADGSFSLGLRITVLPAAIAIGKNQHGTIAGKLNGLMIATTPSGWRIDDTSTRSETPSEKPPFSSCGIPHANSTTSRPARDLALRVAQRPCRAPT